MALREELDNRDSRLANSASKQLRNVVNIVTKTDKIGALRKWARNALHTANIDLSGGAL